MNWTSLKVYLIVILAAINVFLTVSYIDSANKNSRIDNNTLVNTVEFIEKQGVLLDQSIIPTEIYNSKIIECPYGEEYYEKIATAISGSEKESINILPDSSIRINTKNGASFTFDSSFGFSFVRFHNDSEAELLTLDDTGIDNRPTSLTKEQSKELSAFFKAAAQSSDDLSYSVTSVYTKDTGNVIATCYQHINNVPVSSNVLTVEFDKNQIISAIGTWFFPYSAENYTFRLYDQLTILIKEAQSFNVDKDESPSDVRRITSVQHVYSIYRSAANDRVYFIPSWKLVSDDGSERIYNAVNCELYS